MTEDRARGADPASSSIEPPDGRTSDGRAPAGRPPSWRPADQRDVRVRLAHYEQIANAGAEEIVSRINIPSGIARMRDLLLQIANEDVSCRLVDEPCGTGRTNFPSTIDSFEMAGSIKWFDVSKGFGFILPDDGLPDVLLHITALRASGFTTAFEGARIHAIAIKRNKGAQVLSILSMDDSTAIHPSSIQQRNQVAVAPQSVWEMATVKWFSRVRGFGFLRTKTGLDVFVHIETVRRFGMAELRPAQTIEVRYGYGKRGATAAEIRPRPIPQGWPFAQ